MRFIPDDNLSYPVLIKLKNGSSGSGFYLRAENALYLVTARHVLVEESDENNFSLLSESAELISYAKNIKITEPIITSLNLSTSLKNGLLKFNNESDVIIVKLADLEKVGDNKYNLKKFEQSFVIKNMPKDASLLWLPQSYFKSYEEVLVSNEIIIFGYPNSLGRGDQIDPLKPLLRKGIVAGKNINKKTIIADCPVYYGNSGGLVLEIEQISSEKKNFRCIGIVSEFVPFDEKLLSLQHKTISTSVENSGYSVIVPIETILDLLN